MANFYLHEGRRYYVGVPFTYNEINYTRAGATDETFTALGFTQVNIQPRPDDRYYIINSDPKDDGSWDATPRDIEQLKEAEVQQVNTTEGSLLGSTDWYYIRNLETGKAIPDHITERRAAIRAVADQRVALIDKVTTIEELQQLQLPEWPNDNHIVKGTPKTRTRK